MVWRHNKTTGKRGWTGPGVIVAISQTRTSFWIHMRGSLLKCSGEQVRKATDAEYLGTELAKVLSQELLKSRERAGQRGFVDVEVEGALDEEPPEDTRPNVQEAMGIPPSSDISSGSGGLSRMQPMPEDREILSAPLPTVHQPPPPTVDNGGGSVMETQPEMEPSAAASSRASRSMETTPERSVRPRIESADTPQLTPGVTPTTGAPTPPGGWQASGACGPATSSTERRNPYPYPAVPPSQYLVNGDVLAAYDDEHNTKLEAYTVGLHDGNNYTTPVSTPHTFTSEQAVCVCMMLKQKRLGYTRPQRQGWSSV